MRHTWVGIAAACLCWLGLVHAIAPIPAETGYVTDQTGVIEPAEMVRAQMALARYEIATGRKLAVLLVRETPGEELEAFADRVLQAWGMDSPETGGALLLWSAEGYVLIRVAGPLGERLDGEAQSEILSRWVVPAFGRGEAGVGIRQGVERMIAVLDGGEVGHPPAEAAPDGAATDPDVVRSDDRADEALPAGEVPVRDDAVARGGVDAQPPGVPLPPWFEDLPQDLERLRDGLSRNLDGGLAAWLGEARQQAGQLRVMVPALVLQMRGERVEPAFHPLSIGAGYAMAGALLLAVLLLWSRSIGPAMVLLGVGGGMALWVATGFTALACCAVLGGVLVPFLVPVLRAILRGADDSERESPPPSLVPQPRTVVLAPTGARPRRSTPSRATLATVRSGSSHAEKMEEFGRLARTVAKARIQRLRPVHVVLGLMLLVISLPLALLILLGFVVLVACRDGIAHRFADLFIDEKHLRERIKQQLPPPKM